MPTTESEQFPGTPTTSPDTGNRQTEIISNSSLPLLKGGIHVVICRDHLLRHKKITPVLRA
ncbi:hypothetical protein [Halobacillus mangrovi]|uniref:hypothetical protein n=1 Tax=Halobacillus mangrovi TaxID=402384 RepID=UPI003D99C8D7